jgi:hypothetical protein
MELIIIIDEVIEQAENHQTVKSKEIPPVLLRCEQLLKSNH